MAVDVQPAHRSGALKQQNKHHKQGKHRGKREVDRQAPGRFCVKSLSRRNRQEIKRTERRKQALNIRKTKRDEVIAKKRNRGSADTPPHIVVILPLHHQIDTGKVLELLKTCDESSLVKENDQGVTHLSIPRLKQRLSFVIPEYGNQYALLDAVKVADSVLALISPTGGIDDYGLHCLSCLFGQGLPSVTIAVQGFKSIPQKKQGDVRKTLQKSLEKWFPNDKFHSLDNSQDGLVILRQLSNQKLGSIKYRENHPHLLAEKISFEKNSENPEVGTLCLSGYLRGRILNVNNLVHLPGWGDFQMSQIDAPEDPFPLNERLEKNKKKQTEDTTMMDESVIKVLDVAVPSQQVSLEAEVIPDPMEGEQTWPTPEEMAAAEAVNTKKKTRKVPKGTSEYQSAWILDSDEEQDGDASEDDNESDDEFEDAVEEMDESCSDEAESGSEDEEEYEEIEIGEESAIAKYDETIDMEEEKKILLKIREEKMNQMFPDEMDTPVEKPARIRFARYRGLQSFRTSPWDPKENLPLDYARIFQFGNYRRTKKKVLEDETMDGAWPGLYITVHVKNVPREFMDDCKPGKPVILFGLLPHEHKMTVMNFLIQRKTDSDHPIKSKDALIFHVGFRRYSVSPLFSQHTTGSKFKYERFLPMGVSTVATAYAPISFPPSPVLVFQQSVSGNHTLVASGSVLSPNPDRIITKRIVLSGHPFKIHKKSAVIRYMFFNREDVHWFKPVELRTKWGRRGHIKEAMGTHGHMKCVFDSQPKSQDTVLMNLYKRVFPKWTYNPRIPDPPLMKIQEEVDMDDDNDDEKMVETAYSMFD